MINFLHTFSPDKILISLGPINIYWYGFFIMLGIFSAIAVTIKLSSYYPESGINKETIIDLAFWLVLAGLIGARIYHIFLELPYYLKNPLDVFKIWQGGLAIHGGIIAGIIVLWIFTKNHKINFWLLASLLASALALAQAIGRWGNYFNQELFGKPTNLAWGIPIDIFNRPAEYASYKFFHPTFLYESIGNFLIFIILILINKYLIKKRVASHELRVMNYKLCVTSYLILYSVLRFSLEFIRIDDTPTFFGLRWPQIMSIFIIIASIIILLKNKKNYANINT